jgi:hypothetical protein
MDSSSEGLLMAKCRFQSHKKPTNQHRRTSFRTIPLRLLTDSIRCRPGDTDLLSDDVLLDIFNFYANHPSDDEYRTEKNAIEAWQQLPGNHWFTFVGDGEAWFLDHRNT